MKRKCEQGSGINFVTGSALHSVIHFDVRLKKWNLNRLIAIPLSDLLDMLKRGKITLLSPETWEDRNDSLH